MLKNLSFQQLLKIAAFVGIGTSTVGLVLQFKLQNKIRESDYYKQALKLLRQHPGAIKYLGEPIFDKTFNKKADHFIDTSKCYFCVFVKGSIDRGEYCFWGEKQSDVWNIYQAELELDSLPDKKLKIV